jgi:hypothetical protein
MASVIGGLAQFIQQGSCLASQGVDLIAQRTERRQHTRQDHD